MKRPLLLLVIGAILILGLTGCPYESPVPLGDSCGSKPDTSLFGSWVSYSSPANKDTIVIMNFNDREFYVEIRSLDRSGNKSTERGRGFVTNLGNQKIINFTEIGKPGKYLFFKYEIRGKLLIIRSPSDKFIKQPFRSSAELVDFYRKNMDKEWFYEAPDTSLLVK